MSFRYIETGSLVFSPNLNAEVGVDGVKIASTFLEDEQGESFKDRYDILMKYLDM